MFGFSFMSPKNIGLKDDQLPPCTSLLNCVCSIDKDKKSYTLPLQFDNDPASAWSSIQKTIEHSGGKIVERTDDYLWATYTTPLMRYVDDVQLKLDTENNNIHIRSASRIGRRDFGVNRNRVEMLRTQFNKQR